MLFSWFWAGSPHFVWCSVPMVVLGTHSSQWSSGSAPVNQTSTPQQTVNWNHKLALKSVNDSHRTVQLWWQQAAYKNKTKYIWHTSMHLFFGVVCAYLYTFIFLGFCFHQAIVLFFREVECEVFWTHVLEANEDVLFIRREGGRGILNTCARANADVRRALVLQV